MILDSVTGSLRMWDDGEWLLKSFIKGGEVGWKTLEGNCCSLLAVIPLLVGLTGTTRG